MRFWSGSNGQAANRCSLSCNGSWEMPCRHRRPAIYPLPVLPSRRCAANSAELRPRGRGAKATVEIQAAVIFRSYIRDHRRTFGRRYATGQVVAASPRWPSSSWRFHRPRWHLLALGVGADARAARYGRAPLHGYRAEVTPAPRPEPPRVDPSFSMHRAEYRPATCAAGTGT